jgi:hypothetical protein
VYSSKGMSQRDTCLVVTAETWFAMIDRAVAPGLDQLQEYKVRCRIVMAGAEVLMVHPYELAEGPGSFRRLDNGPERGAVGARGPVIPGSHKSSAGSRGRARHFWRQAGPSTTLSPSKAIQESS